MTNPLTLQPDALADYQAWLNTIKQRVVSARLRMALSANRELILFYWELADDCPPTGTPPMGRQTHSSTLGGSTEGLS